MIQDRIGSAMHRVNTIVYVFGGSSFSVGDLDTCENFERNSSPWAMLPKLSHPMPLASACRIKKVIYIVGSCQGVINSFNVMDVAMNELAIVTPLSSHFHTIFTDNKSLYVTSKQCLQKYDPKGTY
jgi:hypothetical protein